MTSKLDAIRERVEKYEAAREAWRADKQNTHEVTEVYIEARDWMEGNAPDDLRALLAVVDKCAAYAREGGETNAMAMFDAIRELTKGGE